MKWTRGLSVQDVAERLAWLSAHAFLDVEPVQFEKMHAELQDSWDTPLAPGTPGIIEDLGDLRIALLHRVDSELA